MCARSIARNLSRPGIQSRRRRGSFCPPISSATSVIRYPVLLRISEEYPELHQSRQEVDIIAEPNTPVFRICTALPVAEKTWSGKSLPVISDALSAASFPSADRQGRRELHDPDRPERRTQPISSCDS